MKKEKNKYDLFPIKFLNGKLELKAYESFVGYKKVSIVSRNNMFITNGIVTLMIPSDAKLVCYDWRNGTEKCNVNILNGLAKGELGKMRADKAKVLKIEEVSHGKFYGDWKLIPQRKNSRARSIYDYEFFYRVNKWVRPTYEFNADQNKECTSGIHFFRTLKEAMEY